MTTRSPATRKRAKARRRRKPAKRNVLLRRAALRHGLSGARMLGLFLLRLAWWLWCILRFFFLLCASAFGGLLTGVHQESHRLRAEHTRIARLNLPPPDHDIRFLSSPNCPDPVALQQELHGVCDGRRN